MRDVRLNRGCRSPPCPRPSRPERERPTGKAPVGTNHGGQTAQDPRGLPDVPPDCPRRRLATAQATVGSVRPTIEYGPSAVFLNSAWYANTNAPTAEDGMPESNGFILGFDPGGKGKFGWSICRVSNGQLQQPLETGLADDAWDALLKVKQELGRYSPSGNPPVLAAGIDAPMFWSKRGNRTVDDSGPIYHRDHDLYTTSSGG